MKVHEGVTWPCSECSYVTNTRVGTNIQISINLKDYLELFFFFALYSAFDNRIPELRRHIDKTVQ